jgi:hypothetical protein
MFITTAADIEILASEIYKLRAESCAEGPQFKVIATLFNGESHVIIPGKAYNHTRFMAMTWVRLAIAEALQDDPRYRKDRGRVMMPALDMSFHAVRKDVRIPHIESEMKKPKKMEKRKKKKDSLWRYRIYGQFDGGGRILLAKGKAETKRDCRSLLEEERKSIVNLIDGAFR